LFDHHIHSSRSDGRVSLEDRAKSVAIRPHGVSDHYPWHELKDHDALRRYMDDAARLGLRVGIEYDLGQAPPLPRSTRDALDYIIGSVHRVMLDDQKVGYDAAGQFLKGRMGPAYGEAARFADPELQRRILDAHLALVREGILETGIDIVGHPTMSPLAARGDPETGYPVEWQEQLSSSRSASSTGSRSRSTRPTACRTARSSSGPTPAARGSPWGRTRTSTCFPSRRPRR